MASRPRGFTALETRNAGVSQLSNLTISLYDPEQLNSLEVCEISKIDYQDIKQRPLEGGLVDPKMGKRGWLGCAG